MIENENHIVTIGGGTGSPIINDALIRAGEENIDAVAAMFDSGGYTQERRQRSVQLLGASGEEVAISDALRILHSLIDPAQLPNGPVSDIKRASTPAEMWSYLLNYRNGMAEVPAYGLALSGFDEETGLAELQRGIELTGVRFMGRALPSSTKSAHIKFQTQSKSWFHGEHVLDEMAASSDMVIDMVLEPDVQAFLPARQAIERASVVFLSPGSMHGSLLSNFLPEGMKQAIANTKAQVFLITNLTSTRNENHNFSPEQYVSLVTRYTGRRPDGIIVPDISQETFEKDNPTAALLYGEENSHFLGWTQSTLGKFESEEGIRVITHQATRVVEVARGKQLVRHDPEALSKTLSELIK